MRTTLYAPDGRPIAHSHIPDVREARRSVLTKPIETRIGSGLANILAVMPDADELMQIEGPDIYDRMRSDDAVFAAEFQLMTRMLGRPWDVRPPEHLSGEPFADEVAEYCKSVFNGLGTEEMLEHLYRAVRHRHAGGQLVYRIEGSVLVPDEFIAERRSIFRFGYRGVRTVQIGGQWREAEPFKWQTHVNEPEPEKPGGRSMLSRVYWPWKFKRAGWEFWLQAMDRFAVPSLAALFELAEYDQGKATEVAETIAIELEKIAGGSVGALANTKSLVQVGGTRAIEGFDKFVEACDRSIYRGILTVTLTVSEGRADSERGNTEIHDEAADEVARWYAKQLAESVTKQTCAYAAILRYGEAARQVLPRFEFDFEEAISLERVLDLMDRNFPVSKDAIYSRYATGLEPKEGDPGDVFQKDTVAPAGGDGASTSVGLRISGTRGTVEFPAEDAGEVQKRLFTYFRNRDIKNRFDKLKADGATWEEAVDAIEKQADVSVSRSTIKNIISK